MLFSVGMLDGPGHIAIDGLSFRYSEQHPPLYRHLHIDIPPGRALAIMGPSGSVLSNLQAGNPNASFEQVVQAATEYPPPPGFSGGYGC
jgi:ABC-type bacteriocin/lantibiotic exporter with double-glycine peptidase domain